jgi:release factor glutamine methyltransferase
MASDSTTPTPADVRLDALLARARARLGSRLEADLLAAHVLDRPRSWLFAHGDALIDAPQARRIERLIEQRAAGRPVAQLLGYRAFYGRDFRVDEHVLIPRPETELLVDLALAADLADAARVLDVGTGTGCIALTLAAERPGWRVTAVDRSPAALNVARANRQALELERVTLLEGDLLEPVAGQRFDLIVSNPPYIAADDAHLERGDLRHEPRMALAGGSDGLELIRRLVDQAVQALNSGGLLMIEHGYDQASAVAGLCRRAGFETVSSHRDLAGIERVTLGRRPAAHS